MTDILHIENLKNISIILYSIANYREASMCRQFKQRLKDKRCYICETSFSDSLQDGFCDHCSMKQLFSK